MDESEEEALFARLHAQLKANPARSAALAAATPETATALARIETSLRSLASGLETAVQRIDGLEKGLEARIETAAARSVAAVRIDVDRRDLRLAAPAAKAAPPSPPAGRRPVRFAGVVLMALIAIGALAAAATRLGYLPSPGAELGHLQVLRAGTEGAPANTGSSVLNTASHPSPGRPAVVPTPPVPQAKPRAQAQPAQPAPAPVLASAMPRPIPMPPAPMPPAPMPPGAAPPASPAATAETVRPAQPRQADAVPAATALPPPRPEPPPAPPRPVTLAIRATAPAWIEIQNGNGKALINRTLRRGETWQTEDDGDLQLSTGYAPGLVVSVNGRPFGLPAGSAVIHKMRLPGSG